MSAISRLIGYGILIFSIGFFAGLLWLNYFQLLIPIGSLMTFVGVFYFFRVADWNEEFRKDPKEDVLTFFWNAIVLKLWTFIFVVWMIMMDLALIIKGPL
jgi:hypothetical protein